MTSIKKNFTYNIILNISSYVASLIVFPYISRVLNAELLGTVNFVNQAVQYFVLFSLMGVMTVGTRAIAECKDNRQQRSEVFSAVFSLSLLATLIVMVVYFICIYIIPAFHEYDRLFLIGAANILFTTIQIEWLYRGIENFKYITIRNIIIRILYIILVFAFVRDESDYILYFALTVGIIVVNALININYSRNFVSFIFSKQLYKEIWGKVYKSFGVFGLNSIMNSFYSTFNVIYLGIVCTKDQVGYYYVSNKVMTICLGVITAFTLTMLPRMSNLLGSNDRNEYDRLLNKSVAVVMNLCVPLSVGLFLYAPNIISLLSGEGYEQAITPLRIIAPVIFINALNQIIVYQVLMPQHKDGPILISTIIAAIVGVLSNFIIVKQMGVNGSAVALCLSTAANFLYCLCYVIRNKQLSFPSRELLSCIIIVSPFFAIWFIVNKLISNSTLVLFIGVFATVLYWSLAKYKFLISLVHLKR